MTEAEITLQVAAELKQGAAQAEYEAAVEKYRPSYLYRPRLSIDGNQWCALFGSNLQDGVAGFGDSPSLAYIAFDSAWYEALPKDTPHATN